MNSNSKITLRILDGPNRGQNYFAIPLPVGIGREFQNSIALNDERVSRYHCKIQEANGKRFLVDIESTNGTKLNGQNIEVAEIHFGDVITVGQTLLIVGSRSEILERIISLEKVDFSSGAFRHLVAGNSVELLPKSIVEEMEEYPGDITGLLEKLHALLPPPLPKGLSADQTVQMADFLQFLVLRMRTLVDSARTNDMTGRVSWSQAEWQSMLDLLSRLNDYRARLLSPEE